MQAAYSSFFREAFITLFEFHIFNKGHLWMIRKIVFAIMLCKITSVITKTGKSYNLYFVDSEFFNLKDFHTYPNYNYMNSVIKSSGLVANSNFLNINNLHLLFHHTANNIARCLVCSNLQLLLIHPFSNSISISLWSTWFLLCDVSRHQFTNIMFQINLQIETFCIYNPIFW